MKLHLPKRLLAAVLLCISVLSTGAYAATEYGDVTYSGYIYNIAAGSSATFHDRTFSNYYQTSEGEWVSSTTWSGTGTSYYNGETQLSTTDSKPFWRYAFGDGAGKYSTLRLDGATSAVYLESQFSPYTLGGIIAEAGDGSYTLGRKGGTCAITLQAEEGQAANLTIKSSTTLSVSNGPLTVASAGVWDVAEGKTLAIGFHNGSALSNAGSVGFNGNLGTVEIKGGGTVDIHSSAMSIGSGTTLKVAAGSTLSLNTSVANSGALVLDGSSVNLTGATGEVITPTQNGFTGLRYSVTLATGSGSVSTEGVSWSFNGTASTDAQYADGVVTGTIAGSVYCIVDGTVNSSTIGEAGYVTGTHVVNVAAGQALNVDDDTVNLADVSGAGNIRISKDVTLLGGTQASPVTTKITGGLTISADKKLTLGSNKDNQYLDTSSITSVTLEAGANIDVCQRPGIVLNNLTVEGTSTIKGTDTYNKDVDAVMMRGTTTINGKLITTAGWKYKMSIEKLAGEGTLSVEGSNEQHTVVIGGTEGKFGTIQINGRGAVTSLVFNGNSTITALNTESGSGDNNSNTVTVNQGASLTTDTFKNSWGIKTTTVNGTLTVNGTYTVSTGGMVNTLEGTGVVNAGTLFVGNVTSKLAISGVTLNLGAGGISVSNGRPIEFGQMTVGVMDGAAGWSTSAGTISLVSADGTTFAPAAGKTITMNGVLSGDGKLIKADEGTLILNAANTYTGGTAINGGTVVVGNNAALGTEAVTLTDGALEVSENVTISNAVTMTGGELTVNGTASNVTANGGSVSIGDNGSVTSLTANDNVVVSGNVDASAIGIAAQKHVTVDSMAKDGIQFAAADGGKVEVANTNTEGSIQYRVGEAAAKVTADSLVAKSASEVAVVNQLAVQSISNEGAGKLIVEGAVDGLQTLAATTGSITLQNVAQQLVVTDLNIGADNAVSIYTGADALTEGVIKVTGNLTSAAGSDLYANLVIGADSVVTLADTLTLHSDVGVEGQFTLAGDMVTNLQNLAEGEQVTLIQGDNLTYSGILANGQDASVILKDVAAGDYTVVADGNVLAIKKAGAVPEPTTGTLSLLALAGLMARRRRK